MRARVVSLNAVDSYPRYRAPKEDGQRLLVPEWQQLVRRCEPKPVSDRKSIQLLGRDLADVAREARQETLQAAWNYSTTYCDPPLDNLAGPVIFTGHQPEIFHPGVWLKNFLAFRLAQQTRGVAVNLVIDGDLCARPEIRVPVGVPEHPRTESIRYDRGQPAVAYEQCTVTDEALWRSFSQRVQKAATALIDPFVEHWWPEVLQKHIAEPLAGRCIAQARHEAELRWGTAALDLPLSMMCQTRSFRWFVVTVLGELPRFQSAYNQALGEYRAKHRIRTSAQPMPDLATNDVWREAPFWIWRNTKPQRRPLFVRTADDFLELSDGADLSLQLPWSADADPQRACQQLDDWEAQGIKLRSRALMTTLFSRLLASELFVHGIGGAKYDQVTDRICRIFFGVDLPSFAVVSGTLLLPIAIPEKDGGLPQEARQKLRELQYHPERWIDENRFRESEAKQIETAKLRKKKAVETPKTPQTAAARHAKIVAANRTLHHFLAGAQQQAASDLRAAEAARRARAILNSREYAFCLFSRSTLQKFLLENSQEFA